MASVLGRFARLCAGARSPGEGLRFLFDLDARLYSLHGEMAVAHGGGVHPKHHLTRYHDFFTARIHAGESVLDIGCGIGAVAHDIASRCGATVTGIDMSEANIATARSRFSHTDLTYLVGDALEIIPEGNFDVVVLSNVLEHIEDRVGFLRRAQSAAQARRWLIRVPLFERDWRVPLKRELGVEWRLDPTHFTEYTQESFQEETVAAGFDITHLEVRWGEIWAELRPRADE
jgi:SAM-dependent methyltransferase